MPRNLTSNVIAQLTASSVIPALFFDGIFGGSHIYLWSGVGDISWNSQTWNGNGYLQFPSGGTETIHSDSESMTLELMGVPSTLISAIFSANTGELGKLYFGFLDTSNAVIADPYLYYQGLFDHAEILEDSNQSSIAVVYESRVSDFNRVREFRYNTQSQAIFYPSDLGFQYVPKLQNWTGFWGNKTKVIKTNKKSPGSRSTRPR